MKSTFILTLTIFCTWITHAQVAPNFTLTDINGQSHQLYEYLDDGKTVILDFYAVWCNPCQTNAPGVEAVYLDMGPDGADEIMILGIEGDDSSTDTEVAQYAIDYDCSNPQINDSENVMDLYNVDFYPTYFVVCPDRSFEPYEGETAEIIEVELTVGVELCEGFQGEEIDARLFSYNSGTVLCSNETTPNITLMNMGSLNLTTVDVQVFINGTLESTTPWSGDLALYDFDFITLPTIDLNGLTDPVLKVALANPNGTTDPNPDNNETTVNIEYGGLEYETENIQFQLYFDNFPQETSWEFKNSIGEIVLSGDGYIGFPNFSPPIDTVITLAEGDCYTFTIYDDIGDGICCAYADPGEGFWKILTDDGTLMAEGGVFTDEESAIFGIASTTNSTEIEIPDFLIYPNPAKSSIIIDHSETDFGWQLMGIDGRIHQRGIANHSSQTVIDFNDQISNGFYLLKITTADGSMAEKILIER